jgi:hypothetical protein
MTAPRNVPREAHGFRFRSKRFARIHGGREFAVPRLLGYRARRPTNRWAHRGENRERFPLLVRAHATP